MVGEVAGALVGAFVGVLVGALVGALVRAFVGDNSERIAVPVGPYRSNVSGSSYLSSLRKE